MNKIALLFLLAPLFCFGQVEELPFYRDAKWIKKNKIAQIYHRAFTANGEGDIESNEYDAVYRFNADGTIDRAFKVFPDKGVDSVTYHYSKGKLITEAYYSNRPGQPDVYEIHYTYDDKGSLAAVENQLEQTVMTYLYHKKQLNLTIFKSEKAGVTISKFYSKEDDKEIIKTVTEQTDGTSSTAEEIKSRDEKGNLTQQMIVQAGQMQLLVFFKNFYTGNRLDGVSMVGQDMKTYQATTAYRYNEKGLRTYESVKLHKPQPDNDKFWRVMASTYEYYYR